MLERRWPLKWLPGFLKGVSAVRRSTLDLIFPGKCTGCEKSWPGDDEGFWCSDCRSSIGWIRSPMCPICGRPFPKSPSAPDHLCGECLASTFHFDRARSAAVHEGIIRDCVHALKFGGHLHHVPSLAQIILESMIHEPDAFEGTIIPVPLHTRRLRQRGFNQAALLARELGKHTGRSVRFDVLIRTQWTEPQTRLNRDERLKNVKDAFDVSSPEIIKGRKILLVDDVYTTGTTLTECARVLKRAGADAVHAVTVTRAVPELNLLRKLGRDSTEHVMPDRG